MTALLHSLYPVSKLRTENYVGLDTKIAVVTSVPGFQIFHLINFVQLAEHHCLTTTLTFSFLCLADSLLKMPYFQLLLWTFISLIFISYMYFFLILLHENNTLKIKVFYANGH